MDNCSRYTSKTFLDDPTVLFRNWINQQGDVARVNFLAQLLIAACLCLYLINSPYFTTVLIAGVVVLVILALHIRNKYRENFRPDRSPPALRTSEAPIIAPRSHDLDYWNPGHIHSAINAESVEYLTPLGAGTQDFSYAPQPAGCPSQRLGGYPYDKFASDLTPEQSLQIRREIGAMSNQYPYRQTVQPTGREQPEAPTTRPPYGPTCCDGSCVEPVNPSLAISNASLAGSYLSTIPQYRGPGWDVPPMPYQPIAPRLDPQLTRTVPNIGTAQGDTVDPNAMLYQPNPDCCNDKPFMAYYHRDDEYTSDVDSILDNMDYAAGMGHREPNEYTPCIRDGRNVGNAEAPASVDNLLGQVRYNYAPIDAYRHPNFIIRSNVDHLKFTTPDGRIWPEYYRVPTETRSQVQAAWDSDSIQFREDMMERLSRKWNARQCQLARAPLRGDTNMHRDPVA